ncbi:MAG: LysR family transcriptional regulator [Treponema sp.]|nr:LysR family transcriptional regulator [Treponema sp.]
MTLQQIKYVLGVASCGSFNKASEKLYISQPSLTSSVHDLENELGFSVFKRTSRGTTPTERGKQFISDAKNLYADYENLIKKYCSQVKKSFSVSALYYAFARKAFVEVVKCYSEEDYDFSFREMKAALVIDDVAEGKSEIGILYLSDVNRDEIEKSFETHSLEFHHLTECNAFVYLHKNHPLAEKESISIDELADYHFVTYDTDDVRSFFTEEILQKYNLTKPITVADRATELNLIKNLNGYTFLSGVYGEDACDDSNEEFISIPLKNLTDEPARNFELGYITKTCARKTDIALTYIDAIRRILHIAGFTC